MAILFVDSYDHFTTVPGDKYNSTATSVGVGNPIPTFTISSGNGRRGTSCFRFTGLNGGTWTGSMHKTVAPGDATCYVGFAWKPSTTSAAMDILSICDSATAQITLKFTAAALLQLLNGTGSGTVLGTSASTISTSYQYIEVFVTIHNSAGAYEVRVNGATVISGSGADTQSTGNTSWNAIKFGNVSTGATGTRTMDYDDLYIADGTNSQTFLGDVRVDALFPSGAGSTTQFTPSTGSNYQNVDETNPNGDTDYNSSSNAGDIDTFATPDAPSSGAVIYAVQPVLYAKKSDSGSATLAPVIRYSGVNYPGTEMYPSTDYGPFLVQVWEQNIAISGAWTETDFNAAEFGYEKVT